MDTLLTKPITLFISLVGMLLLTTSALSGKNSNGTITGQVTDKDFGDGLRGVSVRVEGIETSPRFTDSKGRFQLSNIPVGFHTVVFAKNHFQTARISDVAIAPGGVFTLHMPLVGTDADFTLDVIEVTIDPVVSPKVTHLADNQKATNSLPQQLSHNSE